MRVNRAQKEIPKPQMTSASCRLVHDIVKPGPTELTASRNRPNTTLQSADSLSRIVLPTSLPGLLLLMRQSGVSWTLFPLVAVVCTPSAPGGHAYKHAAMAPFSLPGFSCISLDGLVVYKTNHVGTSPGAEPQDRTCLALHRDLPFELYKGPERHMQNRMRVDRVGGGNLGRRELQSLQVG